MSKLFSDRGKQIRQKILATAATLIYEQGAHPTSIDEVLAASGTGKSQFYHYFKSKAHLVREVIVYQLNQLIAEQRSFLERLDTWAGIEAWFNFIIDWHRQRGYIGGCPIGSLAAELADCDPELRATLAAGFDCWESFLKRGLSAMRTRGDLRPDAGPDVLAEATLAAIQGGILLAKTKKDERPLRNALAVALVSLRSYTSDQAQSAPVQTIGGGIS